MQHSVRKQAPLLPAAPAVLLLVLLLFLMMTKQHHCRLLLVLDRQVQAPYLALPRPTQPQQKGRQKAHLTPLHSQENAMF
jgi:hypothetical protein